MKTAKLIIGIVSIVLTSVILFQSCAASIGDALIDEGGTSGSAGMFVAIAARSSKGGGIVCLILYALAGIIGVTSKGIFTDLVIWGVLCLIFAVVFLIATITHKKQEKPDNLSVS